MLRFLTAVLLFSVSIAAFAQVRDFDMQTADGNAFSPDSIRTPLTLLYFQDPDCDMCHAVTDSLSRSAVVREAVANRRLTVLTVYVGDDRQLWESTLNRFPEEWTNVIDCTFSSLDKYAYSAPPALYLSGPKKDALLSETSARNVISFLETTENLKLRHFSHCFQQHKQLYFVTSQL